MLLIFFIAALNAALAQDYLPLDVPVDDSYYSFTQDEHSPVYSVQVITQSQPYNTNQNTMNLTYYTTYNYTRNLFRFYATLTLSIDQPDVYSDVYMYLSFQPQQDTQWDIGRCHVKYDGNINLPYRLYNVTDHWSTNRPFYGGLDSDLPLDKYQNWVVNPANSNSTCPDPGLLEKCVFTCEIARYFSTQDVNEDFDLQTGGDLNLNVAYMVYVGKTAVQTGASQFIEWRVPMLADNIKVACLGVISSVFLSLLF